MFVKKRGARHMDGKERDRKAICLLSASFSAYILAYLYLLLCCAMKAPEDVGAWGFVLFTLVGALCAYAYGRLPEPEISQECLEELEKMIENMK